jgi:transposase-like protein
MTTPARARYTGYRFPAEIIGHAVWLYFRFPLGLRMVEELLAARGIIVSHETVGQWGANSASNSRARPAEACRGRATNGIWMRSCSRSAVSSTGSGERWTRAALCSTF